MIYIAFLLLTLIILIFALYQLQYFLIFSPTYIKERRLCERCEALEIVSEDATALEGVVYEPKTCKATLLFFAGRSHDSVALIQKLQSTYPDVRIITFNYRSYGKNKGKITEQKLLDDALHIAKIVAKNYGEFYLFGFSIGSSLAAYVASKIDTKALIMIGAFDSINLVAREKFGVKIPEFFTRYSFPTYKFVQEVQSPTYLYVSKHDETTYIQNGRNLAKYIKNLQEYKEYENLSHKEILWESEVVNKINKVIIQ